jgi:hypothetical protein
MSSRRELGQCAISTRRLIEAGARLVNFGAVILALVLRGRRRDTQFTTD